MIESVRSGQPGINAEQYKEFSFKCPCLAEQTKIANFLSAIDEKISHINKKLDLLRQYKKGMMQKIFNQEIRFKDENGEDFPEWEEKNIDEICHIQTGKSNTQDKLSDGKYPFFVRSPIVERSEKYLFDCEAVLTVGDGVGTGKVYHYFKGKFDCHQRVYIMNNFIKTLGKFYYYYFSTFFEKRVHSMTAKTSVDSVRMEMIGKMKINLPSLPEQKKVANFLSAIDEKIALVEKQLASTREYKKGLMQQLFI